MLESERKIDEKELTEQKRILKSVGDVHSGYGFVRMLGRLSEFW